MEKDIAATIVTVSPLYSVLNAEVDRQRQIDGQVCFCLVRFESGFTRCG